MTNDEKLIKNKLGLLELANYLKNVSEVCRRVMGYSWNTFYRVRKAYEEGGIEALKEKSGRRPNVKKRVSEQVGKQCWSWPLRIPPWVRNRSVRP